MDMAHLLSYTLYINMQASKLKNFKEAKFKLDQAALLERLKEMQEDMKKRGGGDDKALGGKENAVNPWWPRMGPGQIQPENHEALPTD